MLCLYVYNVLPPQRLPGSFEDSLCNGQRKIKETRFKKKKKSFKVIGLLVLEKKDFLRFLPYMGMAAMLVITVT